MADPLNPQVGEFSATLDHSHSPAAAPQVPAPFCPVVGIGASAGGLEAFTNFLKAIAPDTGMAFVLVQHLDPNHESILADLLSPHTVMPVEQAVQGERVQANHVYIIPPNTAMAIENGALQLTPRNDERIRHLPIDRFLCSLAKDQRSRAFGVILSGSASDGTIGLKEIQNVGGITFAQDNSARFDSMPGNAIAANAVDFILPPDAIALELARIASHSRRESSTAGSPIEDGPVLMAILSLLREVRSVDFTHYKKPTIIRRLTRRMAIHHKDAQSYLEMLKQVPAELNLLLDDLLINVTEFFRDPEIFEVLASTIFPAILKDRKPDDPVRIWVPGCSSGEEVYSLAICLSEYLTRHNLTYPVHIFGTDISDKAIDAARMGKYGNGLRAKVSPERLAGFFLKLDDGTYQICRPVREQCVFSRHDVTKDAPLARMDLISCRNLLIYFGPILQRRVITTFNYALQPTGCLVLGTSESLGSMTEQFVPLDRDHKVFMRSRRVAKPGVTSEPIKVPAPQIAQEDAAVLIDREVDRMISDEYGPSGLLLDSKYQIVKFRGNVGFYISPPTGTATLDVFKLVREDIAFVLRSALNESADSNSAVRRESVPLRRNNQSETINMVVRPLQGAGLELNFLVLFEETAQREYREARQEMASARSAGDSNGLAEELASTRAYLQSLIEDLRTVNEEAQSSNEELHSTNEELQTAQEELQSSNEELTTTNDEMKSRNSELTTVNNDLLNLLSSMNVPVVMLNKDLRIRRFTPLAEQALNLIPADVGRPISDLKPRIHVPELEHLLAKVIYAPQALEQEVQDNDGRWFSMRINPYTANNKVEGAVMQLLDINQLKHTVKAAELARAHSHTIFETVREPLVVLDLALHIKTANQSFFETFETSPQETLGRSIFEVVNGQWNSPKVQHMLREIASSGQTGLQDVEIENLPGQAGLRTFQLNARLMNREAGQAEILLALEDVSDRKRIAEAKYRRLFETAKDGILIVDADSGETTDANAFILDLFGFSREELLGKAFWESGPLAALPDGKASLDRLRAEEVVRFPDVSLNTKNVGKRDLEVIGNIYYELEKRVVQFNIRDVTERKHFERQMQQTAKLESLGLLAGGIAHDFNNLLTAIMGNASLLLDSTSTHHPGRPQMREIVKATQRAADLTRQMLAYAGKGRYIVELVDLSELVTEISSLLKSSIPKAIDLQLHVSDQLRAVKADATQVRQLVMNLVINGAESVGEGTPGFVRIATTMVELTSDDIYRDYPDQGITPGPYVSLEVQDNGSGMDEATKAKIFDPFFTTKFTGRGLGLSATLGIVKGHRGALKLDTKLGTGTTFKVLFPASTSEAIRKHAKPGPKEVRGEGLILVVDDEDSVLRVAEPILRMHGYQVLTAANGAVALDLVRERGNELALVILDLTMPVMGGEETLTKIKATHPALPVVLSSGYDMSQVVERFDRGIVAAFIQKPYRAEDLRSVVRSSLRELS